MSSIVVVGSGYATQNSVAATLLRLATASAATSIRTKVIQSMPKYMSTQGPEQESDGLAVGKQYTKRRAFTPEEVQSFLSITGDSNPLHSAQAAAAAAGFDAPVVPGAMLSSLFPAIIGSNFPGAVYAAQTVRFRAPAMVTQAIMVEVTVKKRSRAYVVFDTICWDLHGTLLVEGEATAKISAGDTRGS